MESEEAIMENENNSNLESESNIRDRDQQSNEGLIDNVTPYATIAQAPSPSVNLWEKNTSNRHAVNLNAFEGSESSHAAKNTFIDQDYGEHFEESATVVSATVSVSDVREECIPDYEDFIGGDKVSEYKGGSRSRSFENIVNELVTDETQGYSDSGSQEELMEVDDTRLDPVERSVSGYPKHTNRDQQIGVGEMVEPAFQSQQSNDREREFRSNIHASETSYEAADVCGTDQFGSVSSRSMSVLSDSTKYWDDNVDLLVEDSKIFVNDRTAAETWTQDRTTPVLSSPGNAFNNVTGKLQAPSDILEIANNDIVTEGQSNRAQTFEITKWSTPETVTAHSLPDSPELLGSEEKKPDEGLQESPAQLVSSLNDMLSENDVNEAEETVLHVKSVVPMDGRMDITSVSDKTSSDTHVSGRCGFGNASNRIERGEVLSSGDYCVRKVASILDDNVQTSERDYNPKIVNMMSMDLAGRGQASEETYSEYYGLGHSNDTSGEAVSKVIVSRDVITNIFSSCDSSVLLCNTSQTESCVRTVSKREHSVSEDGVAAVSAEVVGDDVNLSGRVTSPQAPEHLDTHVDALPVDKSSASEESTTELVEELVSKVDHTIFQHPDTDDDDDDILEDKSSALESVKEDTSEILVDFSDHTNSSKLEDDVSQNQHISEDTTDVVGEAVQLLDLDARDDNVACDKSSISEESVIENRSEVVGDHTTSCERTKQLNDHEEDAAQDNSEGVKGNITGIVDDALDVSDYITSSEHSTQLDTPIGAITHDRSGTLDEDVREVTKNVNDAVDVSENTISVQHLDASDDTIVEDKNIISEDGVNEDITDIVNEDGVNEDITDIVNEDGVNEDITDIVNDAVKMPNRTISTEHPEHLLEENVTHDKNCISDKGAMEVTTEMHLDTSFNNESTHTTASNRQKKTPLITVVNKNNVSEEEIMEVDGKPSRPKPDSGVSKHIETANRSRTTSRRSDESKKERAWLPSGKAVQQKLETAEYSEKDKRRQKGNVSNNSKTGSTNIVSHPLKNTKTDSKDVGMEIPDVESELSTSFVNDNSLNKLKTEPVSSQSAKPKPGPARRRTRMKAEALKAEALKAEAVKNDNEMKVVVSAKGKILESKVPQNGLDVKDSSRQKELQESADKSPIAASSGDNNKSESPKTKSSKSKVHTCLVCQKICKCKYNIVRNGDVKHLCDDACFKQFRKTPTVFLKSIDSPKPTRKSSKPVRSASPGKDALAVYRQEMESRQSSTYKTCTVCQLLNLNTSEPFCNWKSLDFCGESCLGKFQANLNTSCSFCHAYIPIDMRATCCIKMGNDMRPFCKQRCYNEFKKKLRLCSFCQRDVAGVSGAFTAMVGSDGKFKEFCSQVCMKKLESETPDLVVSCVEKSTSKRETCSLCKKLGSIKYTARFQGKVSKLCSDLCLSAFKYSNKINVNTCNTCAAICTAEEAQAHFVQCDGQVKHFCSDNCVSLFRKTNSKVVPCGWCGTKKLNFDMIEKQDAENKIEVFCSLNCLLLYRVNLQAKSGQIVPCHQCRKVESAQYHLTMSDASVRNFCSYTCVTTFQSNFAAKHSSPGPVQTPTVVPSPQIHPQQPGQLAQQQKQQQQQQQKTSPPSSRSARGRMSTRQAARQQSSTFPVISNVVSLASPQGGDQLPQTPSLQSPPPPPPVAPPVPPPQPAEAPGTVIAAGNIVPSADGKHQILIQAAPPKYGKNKSSQCRPATQTKSTSCRPHSQTKETQTEEMLPKCVMVPIPVPIYIPMPTVMFTAPAPKIVPFPIPIPVPIFIPTSRKSIHGISKAIQDILERMPSDPLEAELLMMAEAVAADKRPGDSDTDSEADTCTEDFSVPVEDDVIRPAPRVDESMMMKKRGEGQGEEDMIQMALRMAEEMSGPIEDLETSVEPVAVSAETPSNQQQHQTIQPFDSQVDEDYIPSRPNQQRGAKRASRGRLPTSRTKRLRVERSYNEDDSMQSEPSVQLPSMEPLPDANYRLKFTYGVNAWRHWIISKNAQIEKTRQLTGSYRMRTFSTDILKCTTDELNYTLCVFIKEVRKPNGDQYSPDSVYYLCLGIQQYLYENGRIDNIFTDSYFEKFTDCLNEILKTLQPKINSQGQMLCRIEEEHLWESKQLGAHSPFILLNTLIYFHTKHFILKTAQEHMSLSFAQILKHWKKGVPVKGQSASSGKNVSLRFYCLANGKKDGLAARKNKDGVPVYEVTENFDNPLRCPVKLYEFFLSKCPESIKNRNDIFYPVPERSCVPDSPVWYSTQSIDVHTMDKMLTRVLLVREIQEAHLHAQPIYL